jgi:L-fucose isomerase-like protein
MHEPSNFSVSDILLIIGAVTTSITGIAVAIITAWRTGTKVDKVSDSVEHVRQLTNSNYNDQKRENELLRVEVKTLTERVVEQEKNRAVLAAELGKTVIQPVVVAPVVVDPSLIVKP